MKMDTGGYLMRQIFGVLECPTGCCIGWSLSTIEQYMAARLLFGIWYTLLVYDL